MVQPGFKSKVNTTLPSSQRLGEFAPNSSYSENIGPFQRKGQQSSKYNGTGCTFNPMDD